MSFEQDKYNEIRNLGNHPWKIAETREVDTHFGNAYATFDNGEIRLRFTRDRGSEMLDVGPGQDRNLGNNLYPLEHVLALVDKNFHKRLLESYTRLCQTDPNSEDWLAADDQTSLLYKYWGQITATFDGAENLQKLETTLHTVQDSFMQALDGIRPEAEPEPDYDESPSARAFR